MKIVMGKESEEMYQEEFQSLFDILHQASLPEQQVFPGWKPIKFSYPCNMSAQQKALCFGGAAKVKKYFCHICACKSKNIAKPNEGNFVCSEYTTKKETNPSWQCYCHPVASQEQSKRYKDLQQNRVNLQKVEKGG